MLDIGCVSAARSSVDYDRIVVVLYYWYIREYLAQAPHCTDLHDSVSGPPSTLWHSPLNKLLRGLDRTALTVYTVLCIDD
mmetsp:Transcript_21487/g.43287  ORF Transcript_21487/g.43287 Transcript_21487/m.43287 type:complete len:80 (-) Transcript_21487:1750-1989(-)